MHVPTFTIKFSIQQTENIDVSVISCDHYLYSTACHLDEVEIYTLRAQIN